MGACQITRDTNRKVNQTKVKALVNFDKEDEFDLYGIHHLVRSTNWYTLGFLELH